MNIILKWTCSSKSNGNSNQNYISAFHNIFKDTIVLSVPQTIIIMFFSLITSCNLFCTFFALVMFTFNYPVFVFYLPVLISYFKRISIFRVFLAPVIMLCSLFFIETFTFTKLTNIRTIRLYLFSFAFFIIWRKLF